MIPHCDKSCNGMEVYIACSKNTVPEFASTPRKTQQRSQNSITICLIAEAHLGLQKFNLARATLQKSDYETITNKIQN